MVGIDDGDTAPVITCRSTARGTRARAPDEELDGFHLRAARAMAASRR